MTPPVPPPGAHGDDGARLAVALGLDPSGILDLAASLNPVAPPLRAALAVTGTALRRYPDPRDATRALAEAMAVPPGCLLLTNGGAEAIALVAAEQPVGWVEEPDFSLYGRHLTTIDRAGPRWRSNPHNPTGRLAPAGERFGVVDEAFYALATGAWTRGDHETGSIVLGSLTKLFALPGLRLGFVLSNDESLIDRLARRQPMWAVNSLACMLLPRLLESADLPGWAARIKQLRADLEAVLARHGLEAVTSDANYVLVPDAPRLRDRLAAEGVIVRDCTSFGLPQAVRIAVPSAGGLERLETALDRLSGSASAAVRQAGDGQAGRGFRQAGGRSSCRSSSGGARPLTGAILVAGTGSDAGKSHLVTGLCRLLARRGVRVAPFKAQNMSLNSFATPAGEEIGRAQGVQALAAGASPEAAMNPVLLKPTGERRSQVVVMGRPVGEMDAATYLRERRHLLMPTVLDALAGLRERFDVVVCEGAGSAAEINLLDGDLSNLGLAAAAGVPAVVVGDIERGGVFAALYGTVALLPPDLAATVKGFVINKFRGDPGVLRPGLDELSSRTGVVCLGVLPFVNGLDIDAEDSLGFERTLRSRSNRRSQRALDVAVVALPHVANFTDLDALAIEPDVTLRRVDGAGGLGDPDLVVLPGSKTTVADLAWLRSTGLANALLALAAAEGGPTLLGICAGYQMFGRRILDDVESGAGEVAGLGLLPVETRFRAEKLTRVRTGRSMGEVVTGYEIRHGCPEVVDGGGDERALSQLDDAWGTGPEGCVAAGGRVVGTNLHGLFENDAFRGAFLSDAAARRGRSFRRSGESFASAREQQIDRLADLIETHLDLEAVLQLIASAGEAR